MGSGVYIQNNRTYWGLVRLVLLGFVLGSGVVHSTVAVVIGVE